MPNASGSVLSPLDRTFDALNQVFRETGHTALKIESRGRGDGSLMVIVAGHIDYPHIVTFEQFRLWQMQRCSSEQAGQVAQFVHCLEDRLAETWEAIFDPGLPVRRGQLEVSTERMKGGQGRFAVIVCASPQQLFKFSLAEWQQWWDALLD